ncbi:MAG: RagB/SusD family nutrient uptake outer membrane protein [Cyclobacteriaceae bacterium]
MKKIQIKILGLLFVLLGSVSSCEFLDQEPLDEVTEVIYFQNTGHFENAANFLYTRFGFEDGDGGTDLSNNVTDGSGNYSWGQTVSDPEDETWDDNYEQLRAVNQLIQKASEYEGDASEITTYVATAHWFRAWHYNKLLRRFGGVPLILIAPNAGSEELYAARNSRYEVVAQMLSDLDVAIAGLPDGADVQGANKGKLSVEAARAFKARILLYEATWERYVGDVTDGDGTTLGAGSAKPAGYPSVEAMLTEAISLSEAVMNVSGPGNTFELWDHSDDADLGQDNMRYLFCIEDGLGNPMGYTKADIKEYILETVYDVDVRGKPGNDSHAKPYGASRKLMDMYPCTDGLPIQHSPLFQGYGTLSSEFQNRDHRVNLTSKVPLTYYWGRGSTGANYGSPIPEDPEYLYVPPLNSTAVRNNSYQGRKFVTENPALEEGNMNYPLIRLAEVYLIFAEAMVELNGSISDADLDRSINLIRARANVGPLTNAIVNTYADLSMLGEIRRERAIELFGENFRMDDLKRWHIAAEEINAGVYLDHITGTEMETAIDPRDNSPIWEETLYALTTSEITTSSYAGFPTVPVGVAILEGAGTRNFTIRNYLDAIPSTQVTLNPALVQNPGW